jgi:AcrR family transcriptional regulator
MSRPADPKAKLALLRSAEAEFIAHGLEGAKVDNIAKAAGVSKGSFYLHFASKEDAFLRVVEGFLAACARSFEQPELTPEALASWQGLLDFWLERDVQTFEFLWQNRGVFTMLPSCQGDYGYLFSSYREQAHASVVRWIEEGKLQGIFRPDVDVSVASMLLFGAFNELAVRLAMSPTKPPISHWVREAQRTFTHAFGVPALVAALPPPAVRITTVPDRASGPLPLPNRPRAVAVGSTGPVAARTKTTNFSNTSANNRQKKTQKG